MLHPQRGPINFSMRPGSAALLPVSTTSTGLLHLSVSARVHHVRSNTGNCHVWPPPCVHHFQCVTYIQYQHPENYVCLVDILEHLGKADNIPFNQLYCLAEDCADRYYMKVIQTLTRLMKNSFHDRSIDFS